MKRNYTIKKFKNRDEWKKARKIGGSDLATIMGVGKWQTKQDIIDRIKNGKIDTKETEIMKIGAQSESPIAKLWEIEHSSHKVIKPPKNNWLFVRKDEPLITVSPDRILDNYTGAIEIKTREVYTEKEYQEWKNGILPPQYFYQVVQYFIVINTLEYVLLKARLKIMKHNEIDRIEELEYLLRRNEWKNTIVEAEAIERKFIKENL